ncbi:DUF1349 domain-containing protein [Pectobacterium sp. A5351]|uniref:DUF1349 domain-containing protein n=1 Tax=Pectobacterium sp. A5351 TaxID=2914983 RepID=UPI00232C2292|nr:DUF1349 domain-containing protein [Pectobacterium sp. A5351]WCG82568.1 DUF1349 domain-containing protein [Pectobacterium sp. A5351]
MSDNQENLLSNGQWLNEPKVWKNDQGSITLTTDKGTDFWRETFSNVIRDTGHFFGVKTGSEFTAQVRVCGKFEKHYDQAGIMVRIDDKNWMKSGIEYSGGLPKLGSVITNVKSDFAASDYHGDAKDFYMKVSVGKGTLRLYVSSNGGDWSLIRLAPFPEADHYLVGPMASTPEREGLEVTFSDFNLSAAM